MEIKKKYILIKDLEVYQLARELSNIAWLVYQKMSWQIKKIIGDQFIEATDSIGANLAEGYHRFHYLDKIKFYYNCRGSLAEACDHWLELLNERKVITKEIYEQYKKIANTLSIKLNNFISSTYKAKNNQFQ